MLGWSPKSICLEQIALLEAHSLTGTRDLEGLINMHHAATVHAPGENRKLPEFQTTASVCPGHGGRHNGRSRNRAGRGEVKRPLTAHSAAPREESPGHLSISPMRLSSGLDCFSFDLKSPGRSSAWHLAGQADTRPSIPANSLVQSCPQTHGNKA